MVQMGLEAQQQLQKDAMHSWTNEHRKTGMKDDKKTEGRKWNFSKKDPNVMDVDVMTVKK